NMESVCGVCAAPPKLAARVCAPQVFKFLTRRPWAVLKNISGASSHVKKEHTNADSLCLLALLLSSSFGPAEERCKQFSARERLVIHCERFAACELISAS